ncbi:unnamed protein product [Rhizoctonia solani]|uniref:SCP domain-containing protein n=1 Tax=Rhizoctonia solani TaxID=456999 RepID=A0A8H2XNI6_9AGAM|nr:unnamed protein product [Rhizoctonia solani]
MTPFSVVASVAVVATSFAAASPAPLIPHERFHNYQVANAGWNWREWFTGGQTRTRYATTWTSTQTSSAFTSLETSVEVPEVTNSVLPATSTVVPTKTRAASATAAAAASSKTSEGSSGNAEIDAYLKGHNDIRAQHGASPLTWATDLSAAAAKWAGNCVWEHSQGQIGDFGENLAAGTGLGAAAAVKMWTDEASEYNPANPQYSHFTQVVWKATTEVGCAVRTCNNLFSGNSGAVEFHVCEYRAPGNVIGQFAENVQA